MGSRALQSIPAFALAMLGERWLMRRRGRDVYEARDAFTSAVMGLGSAAFGALYRAGFVLVFFAVYTADELRAAARRAARPDVATS